jgi:Protein of unknown function (DUF3164).
MKPIDLSNVSSEELEEMLKQKKEQEKQEALVKREAYESIRSEVLHKVEQKVRLVTEEVKGLFDFVVGETSAFYEVMKEYGQLRNGDKQMSYLILSPNFRIEVKTNKVKKFDERADIAASRLIEFLQSYIKQSDKGSDDPMYQLAMTLLERNKYGDLDYKSISKLYELEQKFNNDEYTEIMNLFRESNIVEGTATNFYFYERTDLGVWRKIEPSFNRM